MADYDKEVSSGERFEFGKNWEKFLASVNEARIREAKASLTNMLGKDNFQGTAFIDVGSGSGLFSLAARMLGAQVLSFDYDPYSVNCTNTLKQKYYPQDEQWRIIQGSVLDNDFIASLGKYDVVYSWGVLHHTGNMWQSFDNIIRLVIKDGLVFIAIYNDQGRKSKYWHSIKKMYVKCPKYLRMFLVIPVFIRLWGPALLRDLLRFKPLAKWKNKIKSRGMTPWRDVVDWIGGFPFEVAKPEQLFDYFYSRGFVLQKLTTSGGLGCNEFVFRYKNNTQVKVKNLGKTFSRNKSG